MFKFAKIAVLFIFIFSLIGCTNSEVVTLTLEDGTVYYKGEVNEHNEPHGKGIDYGADGNILVYEGEFINGLPHGKGLKWWNKELGTVYFDGEWNNGDPVYLTPEIGMSKYDITSRTELGFDYNSFTEEIDGEEYEVWEFPKFNTIIIFNGNEKVVEILNN